MRGAESPQRDSESVKVADGSCPPDYDNDLPPQPGGRPRTPISAGGAVSNVAPGNVTLDGTGPFLELVLDHEVFASAVENTPTPLRWDFIVVGYICADGFF